MLKIEKLSKQFGNKLVLDQVSLDEEHGGITVLLGPSGVGKSTLLRILCNLETYDSGSIELDNRPLDPEKINKDHLVGMVFQNFSLFEHWTVAENISKPLEIVLSMGSKKAMQTALELLRKYELTDKADKYPSALSGGQKQRLAIARAVSIKPKLMCMDEPTSSLDPLLTGHVADAIEDLAKEGYIVLVASHDTTLINKLNCTIHLMNEGRIVETADSDAFKASPDLYPKIRQFVLH